MEIANEISITRKNIRKKFRALQAAKAGQESIFKETYKPLIDPLEQMIHKKKNDVESIIFDNKKILKGKKRSNLELTSVSPENKKKIRESNSIEKMEEDEEEEEDEDEEEEVEDVAEVSLVNEYTKKFYGPDADHVFGPSYNADSQLMLGKKTLKLSNNSDIIVGESVYPGTRGLYELVFMKNVREPYTEEDLKNYYSILLETGVHLKTNGQIKSNKGEKYIKIIKDLFQQQKSGEGLQIPLTDRNFSFVYWNNPNNLVQRLMLLVSEKQAGNESNDPEIISLLSELENKKYIKNKDTLRI